MAINLIKGTQTLGAVERERERESISLINVSICHLKIPHFAKTEYYKKSRKI